MSYAYAADLWCDFCGELIKESLTTKGIEDTGDTNDYPQFFDGSREESDSPCHCGSGEDCLEAEYLGKCYDKFTGKILDIKTGAIVCDILTSEGVRYVIEQLNKNPTSVVTFWRKYFDIDWDVNREENY